MSAKMYINVIHRVGKEEDVIPFLTQQEICHKHNIKTTMMLVPHAFSSKKILETLKEQAEKYGDEIGLSLHEIDADTQNEFGIRESMIWLTDFEIRKQILVKYFEKFKEIFGFYPQSVTSYVLDARTLNFLHETYPGVKAAITNCFEEGVKMFQGNQNMWYLFSDGGPWGAYFPSKYNALIPAVGEEGFCGIVGLPHLNRDMIMTLTSRDDLFSSHVTNVIRGKAYDEETGECPYTFDFIDMWLEQLNYNQCVYYNIYVGPSWLTDNTMLDEPGSYTIQLYDENMAYLEEKASEGKVEIMTMSEFGVWYMKTVKVGTPEVNSWRDIICGSKRTMYWYIDPMMRVCLDGNIGGAICDWRPYAGRLNRDTGPDTDNLSNMNQPYLISAEMRGGVHGGSLHTLQVKINGKECGVALKRTRFEVEGTSKVRIKPITLKKDGVSVTVDAVIEFDGRGGMKISRRLLDVSDRQAEVRFVEFDKTCFGETQYQGDMRQCKLRIESACEKKELDYRYGGREMSMKDVKRLTAVYPQIGTQIEMEVLSDHVDGEAIEGYLFNPFLTLQAGKVVKTGEELKTCIRIKQAD